jgi:hypothetical protein
MKNLLQTLNALCDSWRRSQVAGVPLPDIVDASDGTDGSGKKLLSVARGLGKVSRHPRVYFPEMVSRLKPSCAVNRCKNLWHVVDAVDLQFAQLAVNVR